MQRNGFGRESLEVHSARSLVLKESGAAVRLEGRFWRVYSEREGQGGTERALSLGGSFGRRKRRCGVVWCDKQEARGSSLERSSFSGV